MNNKIKKLALGTVQFGLKYGINNQNGQIPKEEARKILDYAFKHGIDTLDTAQVYGTSEKIVGELVKQGKYCFKIISKLAADVRNAEKLDVCFTSSLLNLGSDQLYGYLFHDFTSYKDNPRLLSEIVKLKEEGKVRKIGFSLYYPEEVDYLIENQVPFDIVQFPMNVFDQRFDRCLDALKKKNIEVHIRSVFLQGLMFKRPESLEDYFMKIKPKIIKLNQLADELNVSIASLCLNFITQKPQVDKVVIGVDSLDNLKENIHSLTYRIPEDIIIFLKTLNEESEKIILPFNWMKK